MRENKIKGSRSLDGGIVVFPRPQTPGSWQVMWRTEIGRRYKTFPSLAEANYFASETQMSSAMEMASRPFPVWCQFVSNSSLSWHPQLPVFFVPAEEFLQPPSSTLFLLGGVRGSI